MRILPFLLAPAFLFTACKAPFAPIKDQQVIRIDVKPLPRMQREGHTNITITDPNEIGFVVQSIKALKARGFDHSSPNFDLTFETTSGSRLRLRVSEIEVGPDAPASANNTHWFPSDKASFLRFYDFLLKKTRSPQ